MKYLDKWTLIKRYPTAGKVGKVIRGADICKTFPWLWPEYFARHCELDCGTEIVCTGDDRTCYSVQEDKGKKKIVKVRMTGNEYQWEGRPNIKFFKDKERAKSYQKTNV